MISKGNNSKGLTAAIAAMILMVIAGIGWEIQVLRPRRMQAAMLEFQAHHSGIRDYYLDLEGGCLRDGIELDPAFQKVVGAAENEAKKEVGISKIDPSEPGFFDFEDSKKRILNEKFGFNWRTTYEMNPWLAYN